MSEHGLTALASTHLGEEAEHCDRLALMASGKVVAEGTPDALKRQIADLEGENTALQSKVHLGTVADPGTSQGLGADADERAGSTEQRA